MYGRENTFGMAERCKGLKKEENEKMGSVAVNREK